MSNDTQNNDGDKYVPQPVLNVLRSKIFGANMSPDHTPKDRRKNPSRFKSVFLTQTQLLFIDTVLTFYSLLFLLINNYVLLLFIDPVLTFYSLYFY